MRALVIIAHHQCTRGSPDSLVGGRGERGNMMSLKGPQSIYKVNVLWWKWFINCNFIFFSRQIGISEVLKCPPFISVSLELLISLL